MTTETMNKGLDRLDSEILAVFERLLESSDISIDDDFFDKGGDSLLANELMAELRRLSGKQLPDSLLFEKSTVRALAQRLSEEDAPKQKIAARVGATSDDAKPLIFFHGDWTRGGFYVESLARKLGPKIALIAIAPHGSEREPLPASIEAMAADRLAAVLEAQPEGPYRLAGHCVGGIVAFETARLLLKQGRAVEGVMLIDSPTVVDGDTLRHPRPESSPAEGKDSAAAPPADTPIRPSGPLVDWAMADYERRLHEYRPTPLATPLHILTTEYDGREWVRLSAQARLLHSSGGHFELITTQIDDLADELKLWIAGEATKGSGPVRSARGRDDPPVVGLEGKAAPSPDAAAGRLSLSRRLSKLLAFR